jgi:tetratricopeptide (TPR) repeat protein
MDTRTRVVRSVVLVAIFCTLTLHAGPADKIHITTSSQDARKEFLRGRELFENLKRQESAPYFKKAFSLDPDFALAVAYYAQAEGTARGFFENLVLAAKLAPKVSEGERELILGWYAGGSGKAAEQRAHWESAVRLFPKDERALTLLGIHYFGQQDYRSAAEYFTRAVTVNPDYPQAYNQLGYSRRFLGEYAAAENAFKKYTQLIPDDPNPYDSYAELLLKTGRFDEAIGMYRKALAVDPGFIASYAGIASAYMYQDKPADARDEVAAILKHAHDDGDRRLAYFVSTLTYIEEGKKDEALGEMKKEFAIAEKSGDAASMGADLGTMAAIQFDAGGIDEAEQLYAKALVIVERSTLGEDVKAITRLGNRYNTAMLAAARGDHELALKEVSELERGAEALSNTNLIRLAHEARGRIGLFRKDYPSAAAELALASEQNPYNLYRLGVAYREMGKAEDAARYFKAAVQFNGLPQLNYALIRSKARAALASK